MINKNVSQNTEETDSEKPIILLTAPVDMSLFHEGDKIHIDGEMSDNEELSELKVDIHLSAGHEHKTNAEGDDWQWDTIVQLSGRNQHLHMDVEIPVGITHGVYHFMVSATDKAGNEAFSVLDIEIEGEGHKHD